MIARTMVIVPSRDDPEPGGQREGVNAVAHHGFDRLRGEFLSWQALERNSFVHFSAHVGDRGIARDHLFSPDRPPQEVARPRRDGRGQPPPSRPRTTKRLHSSLNSPLAHRSSIRHRAAYGRPFLSN